MMMELLSNNAVLKISLGLTMAEFKFPIDTVFKAVTLFFVSRQISTQYSLSSFPINTWRSLTPEDGSVILFVYNGEKRVYYCFWNTYTSISREEFQEAQERMIQKLKCVFRGSRKKTLFARLAYCVDCGEGMIFKNDRNAYVCGIYQKEELRFAPHIGSNLMN
ncbi:hypothetical protein [Bacillus safensis]|uniref:hypothetical protein n=1 Tax=Bacillus safensis TaxID=561879 RepID=UPI003C23C809